MQLKVLGGFRAEHGGDVVAVPPGKATLLLQRLVVDRGEVVSVDALVDALWPRNPPRDPRSAVHVKVSQLRRLLEPDRDRGAESSVIVSRGEGYLLPADGLTVDADQFRDLVTDARAARTGGRDEEALQLLESALAFWDGATPVPDIDAAWASAYRDSLVELRQRAREERADLLLAEGADVTAAVADLSQLCAEEPLREPSHELLMRALYRTGRQADALALYEQLRRRLADELGIDPAPPLQDLHHRMLVQDPSLAPPRRPRPPPLPIPATTFVDAGHLPRVRSLLQATRLLTLTGPGGTGKTRLALETAHLTATMSPTWFVDLSGVPVDGDVAEAVALAVGAPAPPPDVLAPTTSPPDAVERIAALLADRDALLILDNCEHVLASAAPLAMSALTRCPHLRILATSRQPLGVPAEAIWSLPPLAVPPDDVSGADARAYPAVQLLLQRVQASSPQKALEDTDVDLLAQIARGLDGIPLALELVGAKARSLSVAAIARRLDERLRILSLGPGVPERHRTLTALIDWSWQLLDDRQRGVATSCGVFSDQFDADDVAAIDPTIPDRRDAEDVLLELAERSILTLRSEAEDGEPVFGMLETVRAYTRERLSERGDRDVLETRLTDRCGAQIADVQPALRGPHRLDALAALDRRGHELLVALDRAIAHGDRAGALQMAVGLGWWWIHGRRDQGCQRLQAALRCDGVSDPLLEADAHRWAAFVGQGILPWPEVEWLAAEAHTRYDALDHDLGRALTLLILAGCERHASRPQGALAHARSALDIFDDLDDRWGRATATLIAVDADLALGRPAGLEQRIDLAHRLFEELGDRWGQLHARTRRALYVQSGSSDIGPDELRRLQGEADAIGIDLPNVSAVDDDRRLPQGSPP